MICTNDILEYEDGNTKRVLKVDYLNDTIIVISMESNKGTPEVYRITYIEEMIKSGVVVKTFHGNNKLLMHEDDISDRDKTIRDNRWKMIKEIVHNIKVYDVHERGNLVKKASKECNVSLPTLYKWIRQYWRMGSCPNALLPMYERCGARGVTKRKMSNKRGAKRTRSDGIGLNITDQERIKLERGYKQFFLNEQRNTLKEAYELTMEKYFSTKGVDGQTVYVDWKECPTPRQFRYWGEKKYSEKERIIARKGIAQYNMNHRPVLGETTYIVPMPGYIYQLDATKAQIDLVHEERYDWIIGSATIYLVIDQFSRLIVGFYVGLKDPSWQDAAMALYWTQRSKIELCAEYGVEINEEMWPNSGLPSKILGDNGELASNYPINLTQNLGVEVTLAPAHRPEQKGIVESLIKNLKNGELKNLPAAREKMRKRGTRDMRKDATLTIRELIVIVIREILYMNNKYMKDYVLDNEMIRDKVKPIPVEIWKWAQNKRMGNYRTFDDDVVKINLMYSKDNITMNHKGIKFRNGKYISTKLHDQGVYEELKNKSIKLRIYFDPRVMQYIYIKWKGEIIQLHDVNRATSSLFWEDIEYFIDNKRKLDEEGEIHNKNQRMIRRAKVKKIIMNAQIRAKLQKRSVSSRINNLPEHREDEEIRLNEKEGFVIAKEEVDNKIYEEEYIPKKYTLEEYEEEYEF